MQTEQPQGTNAVIQPVLQWYVYCCQTVC